MSVHFVVEGALDELIIRKILEHVGYPGGPSRRILVAGGRNRLPSVARSMLARWPAPLVVVADADTTSQEFIDERRRELESYVEWIGPSQVYLIALFAPEVEVALFESSFWVERMRGAPLSESARVEARFAPKPLFNTIVGRARVSPTQAIEGFTTDDWEAIAQHSTMRDIIEFVKEHTDEGVGALAL